MNNYVIDLLNYNTNEGVGDSPTGFSNGHYGCTIKANNMDEAILKVKTKNLMGWRVKIERLYNGRREYGKNFAEIFDKERRTVINL